MSAERDRLAEVPHGRSPRVPVERGTGWAASATTASGRFLTLDQVADEIADRLIGIFRRGDDGARPVFGAYRLPQSDEAWRDRLPFHEYFHGDTGAGLGASHQTGWTGLVASLIIDRHA